MRYDTQGTFNSAASWQAYNAGANGVGNDLVGFYGGAFDGRYIYFVSNRNSAGGYQGESMRYDTQSAFNSSASWQAFDPGANGVGTDPDGFHGAAFDGRYLYFVPFYDGSAYFGEILRFDSKSPPSIPSTVYGGSFF